MAKTRRPRRTLDPVALRRNMAASAEGQTAKAAGRERAPKQPGRVGTVGITAFFDPIVKRQLRMMAGEEDTTIQALIGEALNDLFAKRGKPEVVVSKK
jgi:hypothetical protein